MKPFTAGIALLIAISATLVVLAAVLI